MKGLFLLTLKFLEEGTWLVYSPLSRCPANHQQQRSDLWWQSWLIPDPLFTLSLVRVSPYVQERSTRGWKFQRLQAAPRFEDSPIKRGHGGRLVGQWSREKEPPDGTQFTVLCQTMTLYLTIRGEGSPWPWAGLWAFSPWTSGTAKRKPSVLPQSSARLGQRWKTTDQNRSRTQLLLTTSG